MPGARTGFVLVLKQAEIHQKGLKGKKWHENNEMFSHLGSMLIKSAVFKETCRVSAASNTK